MESMHDIKLPHEWVVYLYDKTVFKMIANKGNCQMKANKEVCTLRTMNDLVYMLQLMECKVNVPSASKPVINLDANDYIIMKKGIEPIWEDPKNCNGGTFTMKVVHTKGYSLWSQFLMHMIGETLTEDSATVNGMTVMFIPDIYNVAGGLSHSLIKIWDANENRNSPEQFLELLPEELADQIKDESLQYLPNNKKRHFGNAKMAGGGRNTRRHYGGFKGK